MSYVLPNSIPCAMVYAVTRARSAGVIPRVSSGISVRAKSSGSPRFVSDTARVTASSSPKAAAVSCGYHRGSKGTDIGVEGRILAAADAFVALSSARPHRPALTSEAAAHELRAAARAGRLDREATAAVLAEAGQRGGQRLADLRPAGLSDREVEVLGLVAQGCSNATIAGRLFISRRTAEHHVQHVYTKIGVSTRAAAALFAVQHDLLPK